MYPKRGVAVKLYEKAERDGPQWEEAIALVLATNLPITSDHCEAWDFGPMTKPKYVADGTT